MGDFTSFLPNFNFYHNDISGQTYKFRITNMTRCYITIHYICSKTNEIKSHQRIKIRKEEEEGDYVLFKHCHSINVNRVKILSNKVNYTDEV